MQKVRLSGLSRAILISFAVLIFVLWWSGLTEHVSFEKIKMHADALRVYTQNHYLQSVCIFIGAYILAILTILMPTTLFSLLGGFLFGLPWGYSYSMFAAIIGASLFFLAVRYLLGSYFQKRFAKRLLGLNSNLEHNGWWYLILLRLIPLAPFFLINIIAGLTRISLTQFMWTTIIGMTPSLFLFTWAGQELATIHSLHDLIYSKVGLIFLGLIMLSVIPWIIIKIVNGKS